MYANKEPTSSGGTTNVGRSNTRRTRSNPDPSLDGSSSVPTIPVPSSVPTIPVPSSVPTNPIPALGFAAYASDLPPFPTPSSIPFPHFGQQSVLQPSFSPGFHIQTPPTFVQQPSGQYDHAYAPLLHLTNMMQYAPKIQQSLLQVYFYVM